MFESTVAAIQKYREHKKRAAAGDGSAKIEVVLSEIALGKIRNHEIARSALDDCGTPTAEQGARIRTAITNLEVQYIQRRKRKASRAGRHFAAMLDEGRIPTGKHASYFWKTVRRYAQESGDKGLVKRATKALQAQASRGK